jgi:hypothetical protein
MEFRIDAFGGADPLPRIILTGFDGNEAQLVTFESAERSLGRGGRDASCHKSDVSTLMKI